ncbi:MAG TPA: hypothetical protein DHW22_12385 [Planctomycetaceae bacterium]|nr:hypothetical protein [Planctomycetaceae bacterium]
MSSSAETGMLALDVGSSRVKIGWYPPNVACLSPSQPGALPIVAPSLPLPDPAFAVTHRDRPRDELSQKIRQGIDPFPWQRAHCYVASVYPEVDSIVENILGDQTCFLAHTDLALEIRVDQPDRVGIDRLLSVVAANRLRRPGQEAIVVSVGTAITVNFISADGAFEGGAILPGLGISAASLNAGTSTLPHLSTASIEAPPEPVGKSTSAAIQAGLFWGAIGAIRQVSHRQRQVSSGQTKKEISRQMFATGGDARLLVDHLGIDGSPAKYIPHLVLAGIAITAEELR